MSRALLQQALDELEQLDHINGFISDLSEEIREELKKPECEPIAWMNPDNNYISLCKGSNTNIPLYTSPQPNPLTPSEFWNAAPWQPMETAPIDKIILIKRKSGTVLRSEYQNGGWTIRSPITGAIVFVTQAIAWLPLPEPEQK